MDITKILMIVLDLIVAVLVAFLVPYLKQKYTIEQLSEAKAWIKIAVQAAEMIYNKGGQGAQKKQYVIDFLKSKGITFDEAALNNLIESAVLELNNAIEGE